MLIHVIGSHCYRHPRWKSTGLVSINLSLVRRRHGEDVWGWRVSTLQVYISSCTKAMPLAQTQLKERNSKVKPVSDLENVYLGLVIIGERIGSLWHPPWFNSVYSGSSEPLPIAPEKAVVCEKYHDASVSEGSLENVLSLTDNHWVQALRHQSSAQGKCNPEEQEQQE